MPTFYLALRAKHGRPRPASLEKLPAYTKAIAARSPVVPTEPEPEFIPPMAGVSALRETPKHRRRRAKVIVVGAGLAGLSAAYELAHKGFYVTVYEARNRVGGRVWSRTDIVKGKTLEAGGELIGSNHTLWLYYAHRFRLRKKFTEVTEYANAAVHLNGRTLPFEDTKALWKQFTALTRKLNTLSKRVNAQRPWLSAAAAETTSWRKSSAVGWTA
jgi:monoamine oxidase